MTALVETHDLTRRYGSNLALDHLNLIIPEGAIFGFIGPNGAGKTTTMRILTTLLAPTSGEARVAGISVTREPRAVRRLVGFMPDFFGVYDNMKSWEYLDFFGRAYSIPAQRRQQLIGELLALVDLAHKRDEPVMSLSRGMKQRLSLARSMMHDPRLLILDEPASGLDPRARIELRELLKELRAMGKTIMISSHILSELAEMCTHIGIIERGKLLAAGEVQEILRTMRPHRIVEIRVVSGAARAEELLRTHADVLELRREGARAESDDENAPLDDETGPHTLLADFAGDEHALGELLAMLIAAGVRISHFAEQAGDLEDIFLHVTKGVV
ncbi:ABC transporter ATP-binding protein [Roseiflexus sp.]|uniref:ABC transporter ATP-binding protein n=1 Tax=Roseiflexus sp. TaxID=2562120 RepID=UPI0021DF0C8F|nr:ABC transporter ATP-binding protein [Roseiflexus sp.]GIW02163.1 MAG: ABC transporter [Roseiflexus sp.]